jgi:hypothetical protein
MSYSGGTYFVTKFAGYRILTISDLTSMSNRAGNSPPSFKRENIVSESVVIDSLPFRGSSSRNPPAVIISRNEWIKANQAGDSYLFHFWDIRADVLYECGVDVVAPHMPNDQGMGEWANVSVPIGAVRRSPL